MGMRGGYTSAKPGTTKADRAAAEKAAEQKAAYDGKIEYGKGSAANIFLGGDDKAVNRAYAAITRGEYNNFQTEYGQFEKDTIKKALTDTSLIDQARADAASANEIGLGISDRTMSRYGGELTPAQMQERNRQSFVGTTLGGLQGVNDAKLAQREQNKALLSDLINIGQGVNRASQAQLGASAQNETQRNNQYQQQKAAQKQQNIQMASMAIMAIAFL